MKTVIKKYKVYEFEELSKEIQEKLIEKEKECELEFYCEVALKDDMEMEAKRLLELYFGNNAEFKDVYYDLSYCQGSGAMIEFELYYYNNKLEIKHNNNYYQHERSFEIYGDISDKRYDILYEKIVKMNKELKKYGYSILEDEESFKEVAKENLKSKEFLEDGTEF